MLSDNHTKREDTKMKVVNEVRFERLQEAVKGAKIHFQCYRLLLQSGRTEAAEEVFNKGLQRLSDADEEANGVKAMDAKIAARY